MAVRTDLLTLGGIVFDDFQAPPQAPFGGKQAMAIHKLPGGNRVIDTLGPDENDMQFTGIIYGQFANAFAGALDALRVSGQTVPLSYIGRFYNVVVKQANLTFVKFPMYAHYNISCVVVTNPMAGILGGVSTSLTSIVSADGATMTGIVNPSH